MADEPIRCDACGAVFQPGDEYFDIPKPVHLACADPTARERLGEDRVKEWAVDQNPTFQGVATEARASGGATQRGVGNNGKLYGKLMEAAHSVAILAVLADTPQTTPCLVCGAAMQNGDEYHQTKEGPVHAACAPEERADPKEWTGNPVVDRDETTREMIQNARAATKLFVDETRQALDDEDIPLDQREDRLREAMQRKLNEYNEVRAGADLEPIV